MPVRTRRCGADTQRARQMMAEVLRLREENATLQQRAAERAEPQPGIVRAAAAPRRRAVPQSAHHSAVACACSRRASPPRCAQASLARARPPSSPWHGLASRVPPPGACEAAAEAAAARAAGAQRM